MLEILGDLAWGLSTNGIQRNFLPQAQTERYGAYPKGHNDIPIILLW
jgi:hypothetical protein